MYATPYMVCTVIALRCVLTSCLKTANYQGQIYPVNQNEVEKTKSYKLQACAVKNSSMENKTVVQILNKLYTELTMRQY